MKKRKLLSRIMTLFLSAMLTITAIPFPSVFAADTGEDVISSVSGVENGDCEGVSDENSEEISEKDNKDVSKEGSEEVSEKESEAISEEISEETSEENSEEVSEEGSEEISEEVSEEISEEVSEETSEEVSEEASEKDSEETSEDNSEEVSEEGSEETSEEDSEEVSEEVSEEASEENGEGEDNSEIITDELDNLSKDSETLSWKFASSTYYIPKGDKITLTYEESYSDLHKKMVFSAKDSSNSQEIKDLSCTLSGDVWSIRDANKALIGTINRNTYILSVKENIDISRITLTASYEGISSSTYIYVREKKIVNQIYFYNGDNNCFEISTALVKNKTFQIEAKGRNNWNQSIYFKDEDAPALKWTSSDTSIATVTPKGGIATVTIKGAGTVRITAQAQDDGKCSNSFVVKVVKEDIILYNPTLSINKYQTGIPDEYFVVYGSHEMMKRKSLEITEVKKGTKSYDLALFEMCSGGYSTMSSIRVTDPKLVPGGTYKVKLKATYNGLEYNENSGSIKSSENPEKDITKELILTLKVSDQLPTIQFDTLTFDVLDGYNYEKKLNYTKNQAPIEQLQIITDESEESKIFAEHFELTGSSSGSIYLRFKLNGSNSGKSYLDYNKTKIKGKMYVKLVDYPGFTVDITVKTPQQKQTFKQKTIPVLHQGCYDKGAEIKIYNVTKKHDQLHFTLQTEPGADSRVELKGDEINGYQVYLKEEEYRNNEIVSIPVTMKVSGYAKVVSLVLKFKIVTVTPKIVTSKNTLMVNINESAFPADLSDNQGLPDKMEVTVNPENVWKAQSSYWKVEKYNPQTKKYESINTTWENGGIAADGLLFYCNASASDFQVYPLRDTSKTVHTPIASTGTHKYRIYMLIDFKDIYKDITVNVIDKPIVVTMQSGSINLVSRSYSYVPVKSKVSNTSAYITGYEIANDTFVADDLNEYSYSDLFVAAYGSYRYIKAKENVYIKAGTYNVPVYVKFNNSVKVKTYIKLTCSVKKPANKGTSTVTIKKANSLWAYLYEKDLCPAQCHVKQIEVLSGGDKFKVTGSYSLNIELLDKAQKKGTYTIKIKYYLKGDDNNTKALTKTIKVKVIE